MISQSNELLICAARNCNYQDINKALSKGADVNYIKRTGENSWYSGDEHTPLSATFESNFEENEYNFISSV